MMSKKSPYEGFDLAGQVNPSGPLDQQLFQSRPRQSSVVAQDVEPPSDSQKQGNKETFSPASLETSNQVSPIPSPLQKATFALPTDVLDVLDDIKRTLRRSYGIRLSKEKLVAEAIERMNEDLSKNKEKSFLVNMHTSKEGGK